MQAMVGIKLPAFDFRSAILCVDPAAWLERAASGTIVVVSRARECHGNVLVPDEWNTLRNT